MLQLWFGKGFVPVVLELLAKSVGMSNWEGVYCDFG